jgi:hypothetical protein
VCWLSEHARSSAAISLENFDVVVVEFEGTLFPIRND